MAVAARNKPVTRRSKGQAQWLREQIEKEAPGWNPVLEMVKIARKHVENARYTVHFNADSQVPPVRDFSLRFGRAFDRPPESSAASRMPSGGAGQGDL